ncbi:hypothetical protein ACQUW5_03700 [Legionella sp. CNM-1927-20]|uniref:hypothetical protein n=1 Tax=Legionella sp. CNM-1927-20 TaxID=3422221 RepID=UPI00403A95F0
MLAELILNKDDEYFLAIAKQGYHSFLMLGVIQNNVPKLLARVGKTNDIDPDIKHHFKFLSKNLTSGTLARLADEGITRRGYKKDSIAYQAYSIDFEQMKEFLALIAYIEERQLANEEIKTALKKTYKTALKVDREVIQAYVPIKENVSGTLNATPNQIVFELKKLREYDSPTAGYLQDLKQTNRIVQEMKQINVSHTCRHSAVDILEAILHYKTDTSKQFFIPLSYRTRLKGGVPDKESFYILPPPPAIYKNLTNYQIKALNKLYERLKKIPKLHSSDPRTRMKFDELKTLYKTIAGTSRISAPGLLLEIVKFENNKKDILFKQRSNHFISFFTPHSATEKALQKIKVNLAKEDNSYSTESNLNPMQHLSFN